MISQKVFSVRQNVGFAPGCVRCAFYAACLALIAATLLWSQGQVNGVVFGRTTDIHGQPQRLLVQLLAQGDVPVGDMYTDSNGQLAFQSLPDGNYYLVAEAPGFKPFRQYVAVDLRIDPKIQVTVFLEPREREPGPPAQIIGGSIKGHELSAKRAARPFDPQALREFEKANEKQKKGDFQSAIAHYRKALRIEPELYAALNNLGAVFLRQKDDAQAEAAFRKSLQINPDDGEAYINLGHVLYEEAKYGPAIENLEEGLKRFPDSPVGQFFLGSSYMKLGELEKAEPHLRKAVALDPASMAPAHLQLANLYLRRRDMTAASTELESYIQTNPSDPQAPATKKMLANMKGHRTN